ncbi:hypothetical protein [Saccharicrinis sp. FJH54]|uniref:hypothetical protein n=1 Tax=Saccharicrinis sp. FJH54 TaxID=3344665 RepID=UPI0035D425F2
MLHKLLHIVLFYLLIFVSVDAQHLPSEEQGSIDISGTSNINTFSFYSQVDNNDVSTIECDTDSISRNYLIHKLALRLSDFKNDNAALKKEFLKLLKYREFPYIRITVRQVQPDHSKNSLEKLPVELTLSGKKKQFLIECDVFQLPDDTYIISGRHCIHLNDFGLEPPSKFFGLVRVNNDVYVNFVIKTNTPQYCYNEIQH